ncbi:MAG: hypothetical protein V1659_05880 [Candidatus Woesearchaeota archaeon]
MVQIVQIKSSVLAAVSDKTGYVEARVQAEKLSQLSQENGLRVADMPMVIRAMTVHPEVRVAIRPDWIDTITSEYHGLRGEDRSYEAWHSAGSLATVKGLEKLFSKVGNYSSMPVSDDEWVAVGNGVFNGQAVVRMHLDDARKGDVPAPGTPYSIFVRLDRDSPKINGRGRLDYDTFMQDDRVLMITGSPEGREALAKMLFGKKEDGGEGWVSVGSDHRINEVGFDAQAKGRQAYLGSGDDGLFGSLRLSYLGRFVLVAPAGVEARENEASSQSRLALNSAELADFLKEQNPLLDRAALEQQIKAYQSQRS